VIIVELPHEVAIDTAADLHSIVEQLLDGLLTCHALVGKPQDLLIFGIPPVVLLLLVMDFAKR